MSKFRSFKGMSSEERLASLEQVVSRNEKLLFLVPDSSMLLSDSEREKLWDDLGPHMFLYTIMIMSKYFSDHYCLDNSETAALLRPYRSGLDYYTVGNGRELALRLLAGDVDPCLKIVANDGIHRTLWSVQPFLAEDDDILLVGLNEMARGWRHDLLAVSETLPSDRQNFINLNLGDKQIQFSEQFSRPQNWRESQRSKRQDVIALSIEAYLDDCDERGRRPDVNDCWRYLKNCPAIEEHLDGNLRFPTYGGEEVKSLTKKQLSDRLRRAMKKR